MREAQRKEMAKCGPLIMVTSGAKTGGGGWGMIGQR